MFDIFQFTIIFVTVSVGTFHIPENQKIEPVVILRYLKGGHHTVGGNVEFECKTTFYSKYVSIIWKAPTFVDTTKSTLEENTNSRYATISTLTIHEAETQHSGYYSCIIIHKQLNYTVATKKMWIRVHDFGDSNIEINDCAYPILEKSYPEIEIRIKAHPKISVTWINNRQEIMKNSSKTAMFLMLTDYVESTNYLAKLVFNNITSDDIGNYTLIVDNGIENKSSKFVVNLPEKINVNLKIINIDKNKMTATYQCSALGNSKPKITWIFVPCDILRCLDYKAEKEKFLDKQILLKDVHHEDRGLHLVSYVSVNLTEVGILKCVTQNSEVIETIFHIHNTFEQMVKSKWDFDNNNHKKLDVGYRQPVALLCLRSLHEYISDVFWYQNGNITNMKKSPYFNSLNETFLDKAVDLLSFDYILENQLGNFTCQVVTRTGEVESRTVEVVSKNMSSLYPEVSLKDVNSGHTVVGQDIKLVCNVTYYRNVRIEWIINNTKLPDHQKIFQKNLQFAIYPNIYVTTNYLTITQANINNTGYYRCVTKENVTSDNHRLWVQVYDVNKPNLTLEKIQFDDEHMNIKVLLTAHSPPKIKWFDNTKKEILNQQNILLNQTQDDANYEVTLTFKNFGPKDFGNYTIVGERGYSMINYSIPVNVTGLLKPTMSIYKMGSRNTTFKCSSTSYPTPTIEWYFKNCTTLKCCLEMDIAKSEFQSLKELRNENNGLQNISYVSVNLSERGVLVCQSSNHLGQNYTYEPILGFDSEFEMSTGNYDNTKYINKTIEFIGKNKIKFICAASKSKYINEFGWSHITNKFDSDQVNILKPENQLDFLLSSFSTSTIYVKKPSKHYYSCSVLTKNNGHLNSQTFQLESRDSDSYYIKISKTNLVNNSIQVDIGNKLQFYCYVEGFPAPTINWYKNNQIISFSKKINFFKRGQVLEIDSVDPDDEGTYICEAVNKYEKRFNYSLLQVVIKNEWLNVQISFVLLALIFIIVLIFIKYRREREIEKKLKSFGLFYLENVSQDKIDSNVRIEDQAVFLPYDRKWEIPFENIKIGKRLGSGAFGVTFQATIVNFFPEDPKKIVAIKTVNLTSGFECIKALVSELKILSHLGSHVNIVNFLGACTRHIVKDELYVVLEFCSFGNLLEYIKLYSENFIDQKDYDSDVFNWTPDPNYCRTKKNNSVSSKDLLLWSFQIARGMEYLGFRRIVHGDLAARNVLLTDDNVVKVCDFGLSKNICYYQEYIKKSQGPLPVKWLAVETIEKGIFSTQSDVWSFGVVLWELFSLGKTPYSGVVVDENFSKKLLNGYRLESPEPATTEIYNMMLSCWQLNPALRPSFTKLADHIGSLLEEPLKNYYINMNNSYILMNKKQNEGFDYLTMISPDVASRNYENFCKLKNTKDNEELK